MSTFLTIALMLGAMVGIFVAFQVSRRATKATKNFIMITFAVAVVLLNHPAGLRLISKVFGIQGAPVLEQGINGIAALAAAILWTGIVIAVFVGGLAKIHKL